MTVRLLVAAVLIATTVGCAVADGDVDGIAPRGRLDGGGGGGDDEDTGSSSTTDTGSSSTTDTGSSSTTDTGSSSGDDTGSSTDTAGPGVGCTTLTATDCTATAEIMSAISGDTGGTASSFGTDNKFLRIRVSEDDSGLFSGKDLRARFTLTSTGTNFDLYVYMGKTAGDGGGVECTTVKSSSAEPMGTPDVVALTWADNRPIGGHDDTRWITVEVRAAETSCSGASWTLTVEGNK